jgi:glycosyltransferase involved in cell wall biosynthesis
MPGTTAVCALTATNGRLAELTGTSLPSIQRQTRCPEHVLVIDDGEDIDEAGTAEIGLALAPIPFTLLGNTTAPGAAGAWNHGLQHLVHSGFDGYVAILDDDDTWDADHVSANLAVALRDGVDVVVSGLRMLKDGEVIPRALIRTLSARQFLTGNPGWQGSNTFVHIDAFRRIGGFRNGLASTNDRDLAIRLLRDPVSGLGFTDKWTATWNFRTKGTQLSSRGTPAKLSGLRWFWHFYGADMVCEEAELFFTRCEELFGFGLDEITSPGPDLPEHRNVRGDLDAG